MYIKNQTNSLCKLAVEHNYFSFSVIDKNLQIMELVLFCINNDKDGYIYNYVRDDLRTSEVDNISVRENAYTLRYINNQTYDMCYNAVKVDGYILKFVDYNLKDIKLVKEALKNDEIALKYIPLHLQTDELLKNYNFKREVLKYIKNPMYLVKNKISKIIKNNFDECIICGEIKDFYFKYTCGHVSCLDCKISKCYYRCESEINIDVLFLNTNLNFVE